MISPSKMTSIFLSLWEDAFVAEFGKRARRHMLAVMCDIFIVDNRLKPAYLWDLLQPNPQKISNLLSYLHGKHALKTVLNVVTLGEDVFVVHLQELIFHVQKLLGATRKAFLVDVSRTLEMPLIAGSKAHSIFEFCLKQILPQLESFCGNSENENIHLTTRKILSIEVEDCWNLSTLFGAFLGYPVLYFCKDNDGNCLSFCPLRVFSIDLMILNEMSNSLDQHSIHKNDMRPISHTAYSFSVPNVLATHVASTIDMWFSGLLEKLEQQTAFLKLVMNQETVTPSVVTL